MTQKIIGGIKYEGRLVADGTLDLQSCSQALAGFDEAIRYFLAVENPTLAAMHLPIPARIRKGSWEAYIPTTIVQWLTMAAGLGASTYIATAAKKLAENDFKDASVRIALKKAIEGIQLLVRLGQHLGHLEFRNITGIRWSEDSEVARIPNREGKYLEIPRDQLKRLAAAPVGLLSRLAAVVETERSLSIRVAKGSRLIEVKITHADRYVFLDDDEDSDEELFPELKHNMAVELDGIVTRENGRTKTLGFLYKQHVLTCMPASNNLLPYKRHLFLFCKMKGVVTRIGVGKQPTEKRPKIVFTGLEILSTKEQLDLGLDLPTL